MNPFVQRVVSAQIWITLALLLLFVWLPLQALIFVATAPFDPGRYAAGRWLRVAAIVSVRLNPLWTFRTSGVRISDPRRPYVAVSNHESYADIFLISHLPWEMKWLSKDLIFRIPIMGWMMRMAGDIAVTRSDRRSRIRAFEDMRDRLSKRVSIMVFPEGTRAPTDELLPFRDGAFRVAVETGTPILPMVVAGTRHCMARGSLLFNRAVAEVRVLEPIPTEGLTTEDVPRLRDEVRALIAEARAGLRADLGIS